MTRKPIIASLLFGASLLLAGCASNRNASDERIDFLEIAIYRAVNSYRSANGLAPLMYDRRIADIARAHSQAMADGRTPFSHEGALERASQARARVPGSGRVSENLAWSTPREELPPFFVDRWRTSERGHHETMLGGYTMTGVGVAIAEDGRVFVTHLFIATGDVIG